MKTVSLSGSSRENVGKKDAKTLRAAGKVPGVLYGDGSNINFAVKETELNKLVWTPAVNFIEIDIDGTKYKTIVQELQFHPVTDRVLHIDLLLVKEDKPITVQLPVELYGVSPGVQQGGKLRLNKRKIKVRGLASAFPETVKINLAPLRIGSTVRYRDINLEGLETVGDQRDVIVSVKMARGAVKVDEEEETEEEEATAEA